MTIDRLSYNLCIVGFGNVGQALVKLLQQKSGELLDKYGIEWRITGIASRSLGWIQILFPLIALMNTDRKP